MSTTHSIKQFDDLPPIDEILMDGDGGAIDLSAADKVFLHVKKGPTVVIHREATIVDGSALGQAVGSLDRGRVVFEFNTASATGETDVNGFFQREWRILWNDGRDQRVPNNENDFLAISKAVAVDD